MKYAFLKNSDKILRLQVEAHLEHRVRFGTLLLNIDLCYLYEKAFQKYTMNKVDLLCG